MALLRLIAEGVGPFKRLDMDFSDGKGNPHPGPHILAGVNGSGKTTVLKTIAWVLEGANSGFDGAQFRQLTAGQGNSSALLAFEGRNAGDLIARARSEGTDELLADWTNEIIKLIRPGPKEFYLLPEPTGAVSVYDYASRNHTARRGSPFAAAYAPAKRLAFMPDPSPSLVLRDRTKNSLAFESTVQNEAVQAWLLGLYSRRAIARDRSQTTESYDRALHLFERALSAMYGDTICFEVDIEKGLQPVLVIRGQRLNFSQVPDGVRVAVGWITDFMMRRDISGAESAGILLLDEIDAHMHPQWQRRVLIAMRESLPGAQVIATTHSPFVISSCPGARVHVFDIDNHGVATNRPPIDSPVGVDVRTTMKEIFGVDSRFDIQTERELDEWHTLNREAAARRLTAKEKARREALQNTLSARSEELRALVGSRPKLADSFIAYISATKPRKANARRH